MRTLLVLSLATVLFGLVSGCLASEPSGASRDGSGSLDAGDQPAPNVGPEPIPEGGTDPHGVPQVTESPVSVRQRPDGTWVANYTVTIVNGVGDLARTRTTYAASSGHANVLGEGRGGYHVLVGVEAQGPTEELARESLASADVRHTDQADGDTLVLSTSVEVPSPLPAVPGLPPLQVGQPLVHYSFDVRLPAHMAHELSASADSGGVRVSGVHGPSVEARAGSGGVRVESVEAGTIAASAGSGGVRVSDCVADTLAASADSGGVSVSSCTADLLEASTGSGSLSAEGVAAGEGRFAASSGSVRVEGLFASLAASAGSGSVSVEATPTATGTYDLSSSSGSIRLELAPGAYDAEASSDSGSVRVSIPGSEEVGEQREGHVHVRSEGFEEADVQTTVTAHASSGSVRVSADG